ncbi:hypothetical protein S7S_12840 [Isoalcanivorax pacificus W11-5]|uniref:SbsA Ig-like domain-containing protein n=1 Tax=Isoalcanivorax pacificus W11-5 TaxID=391936 RepID=A0A0B4XQD9_9GAMM|nr:Ig-like domain-containing protein [Isoalcanivorax pacificus]AJD48980.1 hypothetical protein S7S_12840 [Isoalcanivorax pacificus W11-5]
MKRIMLAACIVSLAACGGDKDDVATDQQQEWEAAKASLVYSFPDNGQQQVPVSSPVVLRFSSPVVVTNAALMDLVELRDGEGSLVEWDRVEEADSGQSLLLYPENNLSPLTNYQLSIARIDLEKGDAESRNLSFSTRAAYEGPKSQVAEEEFRILRTIPNGEDFEVLEFTTFRVQFSQPLERSTVIYGDGADATVQLTGPEGAVDAHVLVSGPYLTVDPKEDLQANTSYKLTFTTGLQSIYGDSMPGGGFGNPGGTIAFEQDITPKATGPRGSMVQNIADTAGQKSPLTGKQINEVPMASVLLGRDTATQASGVVTAELAFVPDFPDATPLRVKRGSLIEGASIEVLIGGEVPAGFESGKVRMDFLSDATGYLLPNPYSDADDAPRQVRLWMDVAVSTETPKANGAITQDMLHIELVGTSLVEDGLMVINAVGVVEPDVLGSERATGLLSFYMEEAADQDNPPVAVPDVSPPVLQSGVPSSVVDYIKRTDPIILNFNEFIDPKTLQGKVTLSKQTATDTEEVDIEYYIDGSALVIKPAEPFEHPTETAGELTYHLSVAPGLADLGGNEWTDGLEDSFSLPVLTELTQGYRTGFGPLPGGGFGSIIIPQGNVTSVQEKSPFILGLYPGFPCALDTIDQNLAQNIAGRCAGGIHPQDTVPPNNSVEPLPADDLIPVVQTPANRPIVVVFSKPMDEGSIVYGRTFQVFEITEDDQIVSAVPGKLETTQDTLQFTPDEPWKPGVLYRYELHSNGDIVSSAVNCDPDTPSLGICSLDGLPLQTQLLSEVEVRDEPVAAAASFPPIASPYYILVKASTALTGGGPVLSQYFRGSEASRTVLQMLRLSDQVDANANLINDSALGVMGPLGIDGGIGASGLSSTPLWYDFEQNETDHIAWQTDSSTGHLVDERHDGTLLDPDGVLPPPNSAKVLSAFYGLKHISDAEFLPDPSIPMVGNAVKYMGANIGCAYESYHLLEDQEGCEQDHVGVLKFLNGQIQRVCYYGKPATCPEDKFTYLHGVLFAEVTDEKTAQGVKVNIHPGHIVTTSFKVYLKSISNNSFDMSDSGYQLMRMRYADEEADKLIPAYISEGADGPALRATVNLYMDAPYLSYDLTEVKNLISSAQGNSAYHNFHSYPVTMNLAGPVAFLPDGRMLVEQYNQEAVYFNLRGNSPLMHVDLVVPPLGTHIRYISTPIK